MYLKFRQKQFKKDTHLEDFENQWPLVLMLFLNFLKSLNRADIDTTTIEAEETEETEEAEEALTEIEEALDPRLHQVDSKTKDLNGDNQTPFGISENLTQTPILE